MSNLESAALDPFNAFVSRCDRGRTGGEEGPLAGLRLCVKDNIAVQGEPFTSGHPAFHDRIATSTAPSVARLLESGARLVGLTRTDSGGFGMTTPEVLNPAHPGKITGGSSGGAAAAVAAGLADIGLGTDTGGSVRVPAACTGLFAYKPGIDDSDVDGVDPLAPGFDTMGLVTRDLATLCQVANSLSNKTSQAAPPTDSGRRLKLAIEQDLRAQADPDTFDSFNRQIDRLRQAGHVVTQYRLPDRVELAEAFGTLVIARARPIYQKLGNNHRRNLGAAAQKALNYAVDTKTIKLAETFLSTAKQDYNDCLADTDYLLSPTMLVPTPERASRSAVLAGKRHPLITVLLAGTCMSNLLGSMALALPGLGAEQTSLHLTTMRHARSAVFAHSERIYRDVFHSDAHQKLQDQTP